MASLLSTHRTTPMRGYHLCEFCPAPEPLQLELPHQTLMLGSGEIWVPSSDSRCIYAAPDLIHHYMAKHHYAPPDEFLAAVANVKNLPEWSATQERARRVRAALIDPRP
jgi:hypothetical protein